MRPSMMAAVLGTAASLSSVVTSFVFVHPSSTHSRATVTRLYLENHIADMIDNELLRLNDIDSWRRQQAEKLKQGNEQALPQGFNFNSAKDFLPNTDAINKIQMRKDKRMAREDPARYCADRCVATGNCQVWEETFAMSAEEVQKFCKECVLSEEEEPCEVPDKFIENAGKNIWEIHP